MCEWQEEQEPMSKLLNKMSFNAAVRDSGGTVNTGEDKLMMQ